MNQELESRTPEEFPIREAAAALIHHMLGVDVYCLQWQTFTGWGHESFFATCGVPVIISDKIH